MNFGSNIKRVRLIFKSFFAFVFILFFVLLKGFSFFLSSFLSFSFLFFLGGGVGVAGIP